jgi:endonuclease/exonuclease/phosphatase family metal-dependent hydrolase
MRVVSWNLWHRHGPWEARQQAIAATLAAIDADVVCAQEVWAEDGGVDQAAALGAALGLHVAHGPQRFWSGISVFNVVLSRWPIMSSDTVLLPCRHGVRHAAVAEIDAPFGRCVCISTHFDHRFDGSAQRVEQASALMSLVAERRSPDGFPVVIGADLNAVPDSDEVRTLTGRTAGTTDGLVFTDAWEVAGDPVGDPGWTWDPANPYLADAAWPRRRLDYVLVSWPRPKGVGKVERCWLAGRDPIDGVVPSDHWAVVADLRS